MFLDLRFPVRGRIAREMSDFSAPPASAPDPSPSASTPFLFTLPPTPPRSVPVAVWVVLAIVVVIAVPALLLIGHQPRRHPSTALPLDPYAANLAITGATMSESTSLSGGKSTYIDGRLRNTGNKTVTGAVAQVFFRNDEGMPPQIETLPIPLVRTREPYVDTQPIAAAPLGPGDDREFRLIFETIQGNWNVQLPEIHIVQVTTR